jgi:hypothetical protein
MHNTLQRTRTVMGIPLKRKAFRLWLEKTFLPLNIRALASSRTMIVLLFLSLLLVFVVSLMDFGSIVAFAFFFFTVFLMLQSLRSTQTSE